MNRPSLFAAPAPPARSAPAKPAAATRRKVRPEPARRVTARPKPAPVRQFRRAPLAPGIHAKPVPTAGEHELRCEACAHRWHGRYVNQCPECERPRVAFVDPDSVPMEPVPRIW